MTIAVDTDVNNYFFPPPPPITLVVVVDTDLINAFTHSFTCSCRLRFIITLFVFLKGIFSTTVIGNYNPLPIFTFAVEKNIIKVSTNGKKELDFIIKS